MPFKSLAQERYFNANRATLEKQGVDGHEQQHQQAIEQMNKGLNDQHQQEVNQTFQHQPSLSTMKKPLGR